MNEERAGVGRAFALFLLVGFTVALIVYLGIADRAARLEEVRRWTDANSDPAVTVIHAVAASKTLQLTLPGTLHGFAETSVYARAGGYVTKWSKDIGDHVSSGETLAEISAPEVDQQLNEAQARLKQLEASVSQAQAVADLGEATNKRTAHLVTEGWSSERQGDNDRYSSEAQRAALAVAKANVIAQQAAVNRLEELIRFKRIAAPFDGIITARNVDVGNLVKAGENTGQAMFGIADIRRMRVYVDVPQALLGSMKPGLRAALTVAGQNQTFEAEVSGVSGMVAEETRTSSVHLQAANPDLKLWPGASTEVTFLIPASSDNLEIPTSALMLGQGDVKVALVDASHHVFLKPIQLGRLLGQTVEVVSGLTKVDVLIDNPPETISSGESVRVVGPLQRRPSELQPISY